MDQNLPESLVPLDPGQMFSDMGEDSDSEILNYEFGPAVRSSNSYVGIGARTVEVGDTEVELRTGELGANTVWEGFVLKRGEHWKNWRQRYFMLLSDGELLGYKNKPLNQEELDFPLNRYTIRGCQVRRTEQPRPNCLVIRGLYMDTDVERLLCTAQSTARDELFHFIVQVRDALEENGRKPRTEDDLVNVGSPQKKVNLEDFEILKVLGKGAFGKVVMCREKMSRTIYAMKILKKSLILEKDEVEHTRTENRVLQSLRHPFLVNLKYSFNNGDRVFFVMEYVGGGELFEHIGRLHQFPEPWVAFYGAEIVLALGYLHHRGIIYRDLKLENLMLDSQGHVKIVDFGLCKDDIFEGRLARTMCGTPAYMAPEVFVKREYGRGVDWWSLGVVIYEMATGELPFYNEKRAEMFKIIFQEKLRFPKSSILSVELKELISGLLEKDSTNRLGSGEGDAEEIMISPFFSDIDWNLLEKRKLIPPFKPQVKDETDAPYVAPEFSALTTDMTPTNPSSVHCNLSDIYFKKYSWSQSYSSRDMELSM